MTHPRALVVEIVVAAPIDVVWNALRDPAAITQWFGWNHPEFAAEIEHIFITHAKEDVSARRLTMKSSSIVRRSASPRRTAMEMSKANGRAESDGGATGVSSSGNQPPPAAVSTVTPTSLSPRHSTFARLPGRASSRPRDFTDTVTNSAGYS